LLQFAMGFYLMKTEICVRTFVNGPLEENCYLIYIQGEKAGVLVDPGSSADELAAKIEETGVKPVLILATHGHFDHVGAVQSLKEKYQAPFACQAMDQDHLKMAQDAPQVDQFLESGEVLETAGLKIKVLATPGHTEGGLCYYMEEHGLLFSGDTLFEGTVGRTDLPGGSALEMTRSIKNVLYPLQDETRVFPGHGEETTMGREKKTNPFMRL
jgi:hydroxyacylglutathione hydrolase